MAKFKLDVSPGSYIVAVSGGVDSMVLLDLLQRQPNLKLAVAHFDHGIRTDSAEDRKLVQKTAQTAGLDFYYQQGHLGPKASEEQARQGRYNFLQQTMADTGAQAIITAHHQDDVLETAILNLLRGTGRRGLSSLQSQPTLLRPLLNHTKTDLLSYAKANHLAWREDSTNLDSRYKRNHIRHDVLPKFSSQQRDELLGLLNNERLLNGQIDQELAAELENHQVGGRLNRRWFVSLPHSVSLEVMASWLRQQQLTYDSKTLERLVTAAKTAQNGRRFAINQGQYLVVSKHDLTVTWHSPVATASNQTGHSV